MLLNVRIDAILLICVISCTRAQKVDLLPVNICKVNYIQCPQIIASTISFTFLDDGSIKVDDQLLQADEYCIEPIIEHEIWVARYCADSCKENNCINKCCPDGMAMNTTTKKCHLSDAKFDIAHLTRDNYVVRHGIVPNCRRGLFLLSPATNKEDEFIIYTDGGLYQRGLIIASASEYCLENFLDGDKANLNALVCFT